MLSFLDFRFDSFQLALDVAQIFLNCFLNTFETSRKDSAAWLCHLATRKGLLEALVSCTRAESIQTLALKDPLCSWVSANTRAQGRHESWPGEAFLHRSGLIFTTKSQISVCCGRCTESLFLVFVRTPNEILATQVLFRHCGSICQPGLWWRPRSLFLCCIPALSARNVPVAFLELVEAP